MDPASAEPGAHPKEADFWPSPLYWLAWAGAGAALWFLADTGNRSDGALGFWLLSIMVSASLVVLGCILGIFQKTRLVGIACLAAGLGAFLANLFLFF